MHRDIFVEIGLDSIESDFHLWIFIQPIQKIHVAYMREYIFVSGCYWIWFQTKMNISICLFNKCVFQIWFGCGYFVQSYVIFVQWSLNPVSPIVANNKHAYNLSVLLLVVVVVVLKVSHNLFICYGFDLVNVSICMMQCYPFVWECSSACAC